jgi:2-octaprenyl-6-methoxyphenol hydroxylase
MSMAIALARNGLKVAAIERNNFSSQLEPDFDGRVSAIALGSKFILDEIGVWQHMQEYTEPIMDIRVTEGQPPFFLHYDHKEIGDNPFGYIIENRYIRHALNKAALQNQNFTLIDNFRLKSIINNDYEVTIERDDGARLTSSLLIGADGKNSQAREFTGIGAYSYNYGQTAIVCTIEHSLPHHGLAQERFFPAGPFAVLPMTGNRSSLVWVEPSDRAGLYLELPEEEFAQEIRERVGSYLGNIQPSGKRFSYPLSLLHAKRYVAGRVALIGDAAHGIHPIAGQGVNLGFRDVAAFSDLIARQYALGLDPGAASLLEQYSKMRNFDNISMIAITDTLNRLFSNNILPIRAARDMGLWAVGKLPAIKKIFMRHAMGLKI